MKRLLSAWMTMGNRESYRVRRRLHKLEWLQLCRKNTVAGKGVCYLVHISSDEGRDVEDAEVLNRHPSLQ